MTETTPSPEAIWQRHCSDSAHALRTLLTAIESETPAPELFDTYVWAKPILAKALHARLQMHLPAECPEFWELRSNIAEIAESKFSEVIPAKYLKVPFGSSVHEDLFAILLERMNEPVETIMLRIATKDSIHTERRTRELREIGLDVTWTINEGLGVYTLKSLDLDQGKIASMVINRIRKDDKKLSREDRLALEAEVLRIMPQAEI